MEYVCVLPAVSAEISVGIIRDLWPLNDFKFPNQSVFERAECRARTDRILSTLKGIIKWGKNLEWQDPLIRWIRYDLLFNLNSIVNFPGSCTEKCQKPQQLKLALNAENVTLSTPHWSSCLAEICSTLHLWTFQSLTCTALYQKVVSKKITP